MRAVNDFVIVEVKKEAPKNVGGLILTDAVDTESRYKKAQVISIDKQFKVVKIGDTILYDQHAGHDVTYEDKVYRVIKVRDIAIVE